jgi:hypothetical protein
MPCLSFKSQRIIASRQCHFSLEVPAKNTVRNPFGWQMLLRCFDLVCCYKLTQFQALHLPKEHPSGSLPPITDALINTKSFARLEALQVSVVLKWPPPTIQLYPQALPGDDVSNPPILDWVSSEKSSFSPPEFRTSLVKLQEKART